MYDSERRRAAAWIVDAGGRFSVKAREDVAKLIPAANAREKREMATGDDLTIVLAHGAWADGSSFEKVIRGLRAVGLKSVAAPLPLTSLTDDVAALERAIDRIAGPVVLVGHAYAGGGDRGDARREVKALVYVAALAPDEGETVADVFYRSRRTRRRRNSPLTHHGSIWLPEEAFAAAFAQHASGEEQAVLFAVQRPIAVRLHQHEGRTAAWRTGRPGSWWPRTTG